MTRHSTPSIVRILHLSDIHRGINAPTSNSSLWGYLVDDIERTYAEDNARLAATDPVLGPPDLVVITGDLTQRADPAEYDLAGEFLEKLAELVGNDRHRIVIVPGNHDVNWEFSRQAFIPATQKQYKQQSLFQEPYRQTVKQARNVRAFWQKIDEATYTKRFNPFKRFFDNFYRTTTPAYSYSLDRSRMYTIHDLSATLGLIVVGFNSCDEVDHLDRRAFINTDAIHLAHADPAFHAGNEGLTRIAAFHHNIRAINHQEDFLDPKYLQILKRHGYELCLHGHAHVAGLDIFDPDLATSLPVLGAGSLAQPYPDRPPAVPRGYNLIVINRQTGSIQAHTRRQDERRAVWSADYQWSGKPYITVRTVQREELIMNSTLTILAPDGTRFQATVPSDLTIEQLKQAFLQSWQPPPEKQKQPFRYYFRFLGLSSPSLQSTATLREAGIGREAVLMLLAEPLEHNTPLGLIVENASGDRFATAVLADTQVGQLADAFLGELPDAGQPRVELIGGPLWYPRFLRPNASFFEEGIGEEVVLRIYSAKADQRS